MLEGQVPVHVPILDHTSTHLNRLPLHSKLALEVAQKMPEVDME